MYGCLSRTLIGDLAHNPGMCPDWESSQRPFGSQAGAQSTEPHQPGLFSVFNQNVYVLLAIINDCHRIVKQNGDSVSVPTKPSRRDTVNINSLVHKLPGVFMLY